MQNKKTIEVNLTTLRKQAEKRLLERGADIANMPLEDINELIHELEVHQIELEMQNEELRQAHLDLEAARDKYTDLYDFAPVGYFSISDKGLILGANLVGATMLGMERGKLTGRRLSQFITKDYQDVFYLHRQKLFQTKTKQVCELKITKKDGIEFYAQLESSPVKDETGNCSSIRFSLSDITERKRVEKKIHNLAFYDGVTCLPNRQLFGEHLSRALAYAKRHKRLLAVLFLDLDHFKHINDTLGHHVGDLLLRCVADRLKKILRKSDLIARHEADDSISYVSRFGGDEFALLLTDLKQPHDAAIVAQRAFYELSKAFVLEEREIFVSGCIGISLYPSDGEDINTLIKNADTAMYHAKNLGRNNFQFYAGYMNTTISRKLTLYSALRKALEHAELTLCYQPQIDINSDKIIGTEALLRWRHPELGAVSPTEFIPLAEEAGLIEPISEWVLRTACSQNIAWQAAGFPPMRVAVNFSNLSFKQRRIVKTISRVLRDIGMAPQLLEIELTEGTLVRNEKETIRALEQLKELGICVAIDDFGTGHFSLYHLRHYPFDAIKIDRCFIKDIGAAQDSTAITTAIIAMARGLQLRVIAEGVETQQQLTFLRLQGCDEVQGYLFSRPVPSNDIIQLLSTGIT